MNHHLTIVQVSSMSSMGTGDYIYRISQPSEAMGRVPGVTVVNVSGTSPHLKEICRDADVLVLHLMGEMDLLPLVAERKQRGLATVYEISDNFMAFPSWVKIRSWFSDPVNLSTTFQLIRLSDAVQGVSNILLERFGFLNGKRRVLENHVEQMGPEPGPAGRRLVMGWAGSLGHTEDIRWIAPVIEDICRRFPNVRFSFMGNGEQFDAVFKDVGRRRFSYRPPGDLGDYYAFLDGLDIGLAPLLETPYNVCRSDVKFIEYASRGAVPVISDVGPYRRRTRHGENAFLFRDPGELKEILETLVRNRALMESVRMRAYRYVKKERLEAANVPGRISFYRETAARRSGAGLPFHLLERSVESAQVYRPAATTAERLLMQGARAEAGNRLEEARRLWRLAADRHEGYAFPLYWLGKSYEKTDPVKAVHCLQRALKRDPESLRSRMLLGRILMSKDDAGASRQFRAALAVFPGFAPAWEGLALIEKGKGRLDEAARLLNRALEVNPFHASSASELGSLYRDRGEYSLAVDAFRVAAGLIPENEAYRVNMAECLLAAGSHDAALRECIGYLDRNPRAGGMYRVMADVLSQRKRTGEALAAREMAQRYG